MTSDILDLLQTDPGRRTIGELIQEREEALHEIRTLRAEIQKLRGARSRSGALATDRDNTEQRAAMAGQLLVRLTDLCEQLAVSRGTIYRWLSEGKFPPPVRIGNRAVRWRVADVEVWCRSLEHVSF